MLLVSVILVISVILIVSYPSLLLFQIYHNITASAMDYVTTNTALNFWASKFTSSTNKLSQLYSTLTVF
jgi:hypothetical protein